MTDFQELNRITLTLLQATGLLMPVAFLTFRYYLRHESDKLSEKGMDYFAKIFMSMITALTTTGFLSTIGLFNFWLKQTLITLSVLSLSLFFLSYGWFLYKLATWPVD